jgi:hypothetical protein
LEGGIWLRGFGLTGGNGFVRDFFCFFFFEVGAQGAEPVEFLDGAAVLALGLGLVAEEKGPGVGLLGGAVEAFAEDEIAILDAGDFDVAIAGELRGHQVHGFAFGVEGLVEAGGEEAGFEAGGADEGQLAAGDALDGEEFLGVDGAVEIQGVLAELVDFVEVFEADDGEGVAGEAVFAGVEGGFHLTGGGTGAGGFLSVDAVGGVLFVGGHVGAAFQFRGSTADGGKRRVETGSGLESVKKS